MTEKTKYQQQILFDEETIELEKDKNLPAEPQLIFDNDDWQAIELEEDEALPSEIGQTHKPSWLWRILAVSLLGVVGIELVDFFTVGFTEAPISTSLYAMVLACIALLSASSLIREFSGLNQLKKRTKLRTEVEKIQNELPHSQNVTDLCDKITQAMSCDITETTEKRWQSLTQEELSDQEKLKLYSRVVLSEVDEKALAEVAKYSSESVVLVALSPIALLDMLIMVWRNLTMVDKVAGLYGLKLGYWSRIKLVKQVFMNMVYAGASEVVTDVSADMLGAGILGKLSGRLAQGLGAGMLTARLGLKTIYLCRPMPFDQQAPRLSQVRGKVVEQIKQLIAKNDS